MIDGHGDDLHRYGKGQIKSNFSTNILTPQSHGRLMEWLASREDLIRSYPEPEPGSLERKIAVREGIDPEAVMVTAGATQAIYMIAQSRRCSNSAILVPTFREYQDACQMAEHHIDYVSSLTGLITADTAWLCCPDNPTGRVIPRTILLDFLGLRRDLTVVDAAYASYTLEPTLSTLDVVELGNTIMLRSLTKDFGVPGLRIGYAIGHPSVLNDVRRMRMPWAVGAIPLAAAGWLLDHADEYPVDARSLHSEALRLSRHLDEFGIEVAPTDANFVLCRLPGGLSAATLKEYLAKTHGILIRDASNFNTLTSSHFRIAAQTPREGDALISAIKQWIDLQQ